ncbi:MAG: ribonuclease III [Omnitrophica bacterium RIFCSPLOWO2_12_FULL_50_11]|nr:MAG: ribonuclease III [Omnitrophica bacterium RIFCSPLOWO2_12_FULL_50_11]
MDQHLPHNLKLSIVVPVYRSESILPSLVGEVRAAMLEQGLQDDFELVLVNDASTDGSWMRIKQLAEEHKFIVAISLTKNFGQHNATMAGLNYARGDVVVIMDDDLQHSPSAISSLLDGLKSGADVCFVRYRNRQHASWKKLGSWFNDLVATILLGKPRGLYLSSFKALKHPIVEEIIKYDGPYAYIDGLILDVTRSIIAIDIEHEARFSGKGNYTLKKSISLWLKMATSFSILPLRIASVAGIVLATLSLVLIMIIVIQKFSHPEIPAGWASLAAAILFVGGAQFACIGLVGEYLGRAYLKLNRKPQFVVREITHATQIVTASVRGGGGYEQ